MGRNGIPLTGGQGSMSKLKSGQVAVWATRTLMDLVGPFASTSECPLEKWFRDAKIYELFEGTAEIQRLVISRMQVDRVPRPPARGGGDRRRGAPSPAARRLGRGHAVALAGAACERARRPLTSTSLTFRASRRAGDPHRGAWPARRREP